jgi:integrase
VHQSTLFESADAWVAQPEAAFDALLAHMSNEGRALRPSSLRIYRGQFARLLSWLRERNAALLDLTPERLDEFFDERGVGRATRHRYLLVFSRLYTEMRRLRVGVGNPARELLTAKRAPEPPPPSALDPASAWRILEASSAIGPVGWKRDRLVTLVTVLLAAGLRTSEILALRLDQIHWESAHLRVPAHRPQPAREVPMRPLAATALKRWVELRDLAACQGPLVFPGTQDGVPLAASTLFRQVRACLDRAGVHARYEGPMLLRNTCAAWWLAEADLPTVARAMGYWKDDTPEQFLDMSLLWLGQIHAFGPTLGCVARKSR